MESMQRLLFWLLEGTKGGPTRIQLLKLLVKKPMNLNQLAHAAGLHYKTVEHHVELMMENSVLECTGKGYGRMYFVSEIVLAQQDVADMIRGGRNGKKKQQ